MRKYMKILYFTLVLAFLSVSGCSGLGSTSTAPDPIVGKWKTTVGDMEYHIVFYKDGRAEFSQNQKSPDISLGSWKCTWKSSGQNEYVVTGSLCANENWVYIPSSDTIQGPFVYPDQIFHRYQ
jgi:hypothetical protein